MTLAKIKTEEERARLDAIFAEIKAAERGELFQRDERTQEQIDADNRKAKIDRFANAEMKEFIGNVKANIGSNAFNTKWEQILSKFIIERMAPLNEELNILRNFVQGVSARLEKAEKSAREQDNHHYYKIFAEGVKKLLDSI